MPFEITPAPEPEIDFVPSPVTVSVNPIGFPQFIQWEANGALLGEPNVQVIDFVGEGIQATRGEGEHYNVITVRLVQSATYYTSWPYPLFVDEAFDLGVSVPQRGLLWGATSEEFDLDLSVPLGGSVDVILVTYGDALPDEFDLDVSEPVEGTLDDVLVVYEDALPDTFDMGVSVPRSGTLADVLVAYTNALPDDFDLGISIPLTGTLV